MGDMHVQVGVDPDRQLRRDRVWDAGDGRLLSVAGGDGTRAGRADSTARSLGDRLVSGHVRPVGVPWWPRLGPTGQTLGTRPVDNRVRPRHDHHAINHATAQLCADRTSPIKTATADHRSTIPWEEIAKELDLPSSYGS
jgi:hypothetical protein